MSRHLLYILGTRPEAIRSAKTLELLAGCNKLTTSVVNTGQHYDDHMMGSFFRELDIRVPDVDLKVGSAPPAQQTAEVIRRVGQFLSDEPHDALCVFGDTNSSLGAAIAASKCGVPIIHIEAGCRSFDMRMAEENNRRMIDHISGLLLTMSNVGTKNLLSEEVRGKIIQTGDPQYDTFLKVVARLPPIKVRGSTGLLTLHRAENVDDPKRLAAFIDVLDVAGRDLGITWLYPVHPRAAANLPRQLPRTFNPVEPLGYGELLGHLSSSKVCVTDSGGLQKEAFWLHIPCVTVQLATGWPETVYQGANVLASDPSNVLESIENVLENFSRADFTNPFGDGQAAEKIVTAILDWLQCS